MGLLLRLALLSGLYCAVTRRVRWKTVLALAIVVFFIRMATTSRTTDSPVWDYPVLLGFAGA